MQKDEIKWRAVAKDRIRYLVKNFKHERPGEATHSIYFISFTRSREDLTPDGLYIGETKQAVETRFEQHIAGGLYAGRIFKGKFARNGILLRDLNRLVPKMSEHDAKRFERVLLDALRGKGIYNRCIRGLPARKVRGA